MTRPLGLLALLCALGAASRPAAAQMCQGGIAVRVDQRGFTFVVEEVRGLLPNTFDVPAISEVVMDWPLTPDDARVEMGPAPGTVSLRGMDFVLTPEGALRMRISVDVDIDGPARVSNAFAGFGTDRCRVELRLSELQFEADFTLQTFGDHLAVRLGETRVSSNDAQRVVRVTECAVGDLYNALNSVLGQETEVGTQKWLEEFVRTRVPPLLERALMSSPEGSLEGRPIRFGAQLREARTDAGGLLLRADVNVEPLNQGFASCLNVRSPPLAPSCEREAPAPLPNGAMYAASFSEGLVNRALHATWRSGLLCVDSSQLDLPEIAQNIDRLAGTLGLPPGSTVSFNATPGKPPWVNFSQRDGARLMVDDLQLQLRMNASDGRSGSLDLEASFSVAATPTLDPTTNSLGLDLGEVGVTRVEIGHGGQQDAALQLDPARLQRFVSDVALPLLRRQLERSQLTPSVVQAQSYVLALRTVFVADGYVSVHGDAHRPSAGADLSPPDTRLLESPGALVGPQILPLKVTGADDSTPPELLRFQVRVDGGPWSEPRFGGLVDAVIHGGQHQVEIAAVDLRGNVDPSPVSLVLLVDDVPPQIHVTDRPNELIKDGPVSIGFVAQDDRTPVAAISFTAELLRVEDNGGALETVQQQELPGGTTRAGFNARGDGLYRVRITAHDQAGNVSSAEIGLIVEGAGCNTSGAVRPGSTLAALALALAALLLLYRARRRRRGRRTC